jgi:hypothetical protein
MFALLVTHEVATYNPPPPPPPPGRGGARALHTNFIITPLVTTSFFSFFFFGGKLMNCDLNMYSHIPYKSLQDCDFKPPQKKKKNLQNSLVMLK